MKHSTLVGTILGLTLLVSPMAAFAQVDDAPPAAPPAPRQPQAGQNSQRPPQQGDRAVRRQGRGDAGRANQLSPPSPDNAPEASKNNDGPRGPRAAPPPPRADADQPSGEQGGQWQGMKNKRGKVMQRLRMWRAIALAERRGQGGFAGRQPQRFEGRQFAQPAPDGPPRGGMRSPMNRGMNGPMQGPMRGRFRAQQPQEQMGPMPPRGTGEGRGMMRGRFGPDGGGPQGQWRGIPGGQDRQGVRGQCRGPGPGMGLMQPDRQLRQARPMGPDMRSPQRNNPPMNNRRPRGQTGQRGDAPPPPPSDDVPQSPTPSPRNRPI